MDHVLDDVGEGPLRADDDRLITDRTKAFLTWRYAGCPSVASRAIRADDGVVLVRFRRRGGAVECTVSDILGTVAPRVAGRAVRDAMREVGADYAIATSANRIRGMVPAPGLGPIQTRRPVSATPCLLPLALTLGDVELF